MRKHVKEPVRLTSGDFAHHPDSGSLGQYSQQRLYAWVEILKAIDRVDLREQLAKSLHKKVFPAYRVAADREEKLKTWPPDPGCLGIAVKTGKASGEMTALWNALSAWLKRWWLPVGGIGYLVMHTLAAWTREPRMARSKTWCIPLSNSPSSFPWGPSITITIDGWNPQTERRSVAKQRILARVEKELDVRLDAVEAQATVEGMQPSPTKRQQEHFDWFVRYQILGEPITILARGCFPPDDRYGDPDNARKTVSEGINSVGRLLDWNDWRRPAEGGHPHS